MTLDYGEAYLELNYFFYFLCLRSQADNGTCLLSKHRNVSQVRILPEALEIIYDNCNSLFHKT